MRVAAALLILFVVHTSSLWRPSVSLAGGFGDPFAHAAIPEWYCSKVAKWDFATDRFFAPYGVNLASNYDSPFPFILTCPFYEMGSQGQFHLFAALQVLFILLSAWLVARQLFRRSIWQIAYVLFAWWTGFYISRVTQHYTLLSGIWGFQMILWMSMTIRWQRTMQVIGYGALLALVFCGSFQNIAMLSAPFLLLIVYSIFKNGSEWNKRSSLNLLASLGVFALVFGYLFGPMFIAYFSQDFPTLPSDRRFYNLDLLSPFIPWADNMIAGWIPVSLDLERFNSFDLVVMVLLVWSAIYRSFWKQPLNRLLLSIALISWIASLGPQFRFANEVLAGNPLDDILKSLPPFSLSRTPGRMAAVTSMAFVFLSFSFLKWKFGEATRALPIFLIGWILVTGPILNNEIFLPVLPYREIFPMAALETIKRTPGDNIVVNIPIALKQDQTQNFMQLFHGKRISSGYLAYTAVGPNLLRRVGEDQFLNQLNCKNQTFGFQNAGLVTDTTLLRLYLKRMSYKFMIVNKILLVDPSCSELVTWIKSLQQQPWVKTIDENPNFIVMQAE